PGGPHDEPQHELMGRVTTQMLELMEVGWSWFPRDDGEIEPALERAVAHMTRTSRPYALVMKKDSVAPYELRSAPTRREDAPRAIRGSFGASRPTREEALLAVQRAANDADVVVATTGYTGRELYACEDRPNQLYVVGSMGCASSLALGLAWAKPDRRVIVLDGDGAALMRLGAFATLAYERLPNLVHVLLDNEAHESTGAQSTVSHSMDLAAVAHGCGYPDVARIGSAVELEDALRDRAPGLRFLHVKTRHGVRADLPRPKVKPAEVAQRLRKLLA
ncbi:MAG TPA: thiamine pyrophosphate-dependent enzyme, partial [Labilithrix sp.]